MKKPNFFIIGAPKCGTTTLNNILRSHPQIFVPLSFEPQFWCSDFPEIIDYTTETYLDLFKDADANHLAVGEKSTIYLYSEMAVKNILDFDPDARLIVMLRNPVDLVYSWHSQLFFSYMENNSNFERAWALQDSRLAGKNISEHCKLPFSLQYREIGRLGKYIERLYATAPRAQVMTILMDDFHADNRKIYAEVLEYLGVPFAPMQDPRHLNANRRHRSRLLGSLLAHGTSSNLRRIGRTIAGLPGLRKLPIKRTLAELNKTEVKREPLSAEFRQMLIEEFREDVLKLEQLIERDIQHWLA